MKIIKKYTAIKLETETVGDNEFQNVKLTYGAIGGPYYSRDYPTEEFDTEEEALEYAYKTDKYARWLVIPFVKFDNYS